MIDKLADWNERRKINKAIRRQAFAEKINNAKQRWLMIPVPANYGLIIVFFLVFATLFQIFFWGASMATIIEPWIKSFNWEFDATWYTTRSFRNAPILIVVIPAFICLWKGLTAPLSDNK